MLNIVAVPHGHVPQSTPGSIFQFIQPSGERFGGGRDSISRGQNKGYGTLKSSKSVVADTTPGYKVNAERSYPNTSP